jgi:hypothetical protein
MCATGCRALIDSLLLLAFMNASCTALLLSCCYCCRQALTLPDRTSCCKCVYCVLREQFLPLLRSEPDERVEEVGQGYAKGH